MDMVQVDMVSLTQFEQALELFKLNIQQHCNTLQTGMTECGRFMKDESSQTALKGTADTIAEISRCLGHVDNALDYIRDLKNATQNASLYR